MNKNIKIVCNKYWSVNMNQEEMLNKEIGRRIYAIRKMHKLSQEKMAAELDIGSTQHYQKIEYGTSKVTTSQILKLYDKFGATPDFIILGKVSNEKEYVYDFLTRPTEERIKIFIEITRHAFGGQQCEFEIQLKEK